MAPRQLSIVNRRAGGTGAPSRSDPESDRTQALIEKFLALPTRPRTTGAKTDQRLVRLASILLNTQAMLAESFDFAFAHSSIEQVLLFLYVRQGQGRVTSLRSLCSAPLLRPGTVALRWAAKLHADGALELTQADETNDRSIRLTSDGVCRLERWLHLIDGEFARASLSEDPPGLLPEHPKRA
jgi:hypothetical protein